MKLKLSHSQKVRAIVCFVGTIFVALAVTLLRHAALGMDPANGFSVGTSEHLHVPVGTVVATACVVWIIPSLLFYRKLIGFGTVVMFCFGFFVDMWNFILHSIFAESTFIMLDESLILRFLLTIVGICLLAFAASFYMVADMGLAPYDAIPFVIEKMAKMKFKYARMIVDCTHLILTVLVTLPDGTTLNFVGVTTVMLALSLGPMLGFLMDNVSRPIVQSLSRG